MKTSRLLYIVLALAMSMSLTACGTKPNNVEAPSGVEKSTFPRPYPDIKTDPAAPAQ